MDRGMSRREAWTSGSVIPWAKHRQQTPMTRLDKNDPHCTRCGRTTDEVGGHLGGLIERADGGPDEVLCIDCMTPQQRREHAELVSWPDADR